MQNKILDKKSRNTIITAKYLERNINPNDQLFGLLSIIYYNWASYTGIEYKYDSYYVSTDSNEAILGLIMVNIPHCVAYKLSQIAKSHGYDTRLTTDYMLIYDEDLIVKKYKS
jgi:hypothetical protein